MRNQNQEPEKQEKPFLRIYSGPENHETKSAADKGRSSRYFTDAEVESYWDGRIPAIRFSARIAA